MAGCSAINHIALNGGVPLYSLFGNTDFDNSYTVTIDSKDYYLPKSLKNITIVEGSQKIVKHSFNSSKIKNIIMPYDITVIEEYAFYKNGELDSIVIPQTNELERIEAYAFMNACLSCLLRYMRMLAISGTELFITAPCLKMWSFYLRF